MRLGVGWYTSIVCTKTIFLIRHRAMAIARLTQLAIARLTQLHGLPCHGDYSRQ